MALFQKSVLKKYLKSIDREKLKPIYEKYKSIFFSIKKQEEIRQVKEERYQEGFLRDLFVNFLGYTINTDDDSNLITEQKDEIGQKKADGAILRDKLVIAVIELKSTKTKDLESIREQAFGYKVNHSNCSYVITSNFEKLRFYIDDAVNYEEFNLFTLQEEQFYLLYLCLSKENIFSDLPLKIKKESLVEEAAITKNFYKDYSSFKRELYASLVKSNLNNSIFDSINLEKEKKEKEVKLILFKKSQKLIDRLLFIFFAEDRGLVPPNFTREILQKWEYLRELDEEQPVYNILKKHFFYLDKGRAKSSQYDEIFAYNGGLFKEDKFLNSLMIDDTLLYKNCKNLSNYDFESSIDVNILGHIFENSLNEIESIQAEIEGKTVEKEKTKRKKDGIFYTPKYITKYIVDNTLGKLCEEKRKELNIIENEYKKGSKGRKEITKERLKKTLDAYREWLLQLTIVDPACGSGAFLNQALDFLITEHEHVDELEAFLRGGGMVFRNIENSILENNIFGVDINEESVEIAKLSLWLRTAKKGRKLSSLSANIRCGNSLIDDKELAGDKAFNWQEQFPKVFEKGGFDVVIGNPPYVQLQTMGKESDKLKKQGYKTFIKTGDLYVLFYELGNNILKNKGLLGYITSNKWMRAKYGEKLREFFSKNIEAKILIDLGSGIFEGATVDSNILIFSKNSVEKQNLFAIDLSKKESITDFSPYFKDGVNIEELSEESWVISNPIEREIQRKIKEIGTPLKDWGITINRGVLTGFNEAFIITKEKKEQLIKEDPKSAEIIKPILRGRDIKRYRADFAELYLINTHNGYVKDDGKVVPLINVENYQAIKKHLDSYLDKLEKRYDKGSTPYNLRNCAYYEEFEKEKIVWQRITHEPTFTCSLPNEYILDSMAFLSSFNSVRGRYFLAFLNCKLVKFWANKNVHQYGETGFRLSNQYVEKIPIPKISESEQQPFVEMAEIMLGLNEKLQKNCKNFQSYLIDKFELKKLNKKLMNYSKLKKSDFFKELKKITKLKPKEEKEWGEWFEEEKETINDLQLQIDKSDKEINQMVYKLYDLTDEEIKIVEQDTHI